MRFGHVTFLGLTRLLQAFLPPKWKKANGRHRVSYSTSLSSPICHKGSSFRIRAPMLGYPTFPKERLHFSLYISSKIFKRVYEYGIWEGQHFNSSLESDIFSLLLRSVTSNEWLESWEDGRHFRDGLDRGRFEIQWTYWERRRVMYVICSKPLQ